MGEIKPIKAYKASSKRIRLHSMSETEMRDLIAATTDLDTQTDYIERFNKALADRRACIFYLPWKIEDKKTGEEIGWFMYDGPMAENTFRVNIFINEEKRRQGYAFEALKTMASYSEMANAECYVIEGLTESDNEAAISLMKKIGFTELEEREGKVRLALFRRFVPSAVTWMCIGMLLGISFDTTLGNSMGMIVGIALGYALGASVDKKNLTKYVTIVNSVREKYNLTPVTEDDIKNQTRVFKKQAKPEKMDTEENTDSEPSEDKNEE